MAWAGKHPLVREWLHAGWQKNYSHTQRSILYETCCPQRGILLPLLCCLVVDKVIEDLDGNGCFKLGNVLSSSVENSQCFTNPLGGFEYGTTVMQQTSIKNPLRKGSAPGSISYETTSIRGNQQPHIFESVELLCVGKQGLRKKVK